MDHLELLDQRHTTDPPAALQEIVSLLRLDIHMLPACQPRIHSYHELLDRHRIMQGNSEEMGFIEIREFLFPCKYRMRQK